MSTITTNEEIQEAIRRDVAPYVQSHGGVIEFCGFDSGVVRVRLSGACQGCSAVNITLKAGVERMLRRAFVEVDRVELQTA